MMSNATNPQKEGNSLELAKISGDLSNLARLQMTAIAEPTFLFGTRGMDQNRFPDSTVKLSASLYPRGGEAGHEAESEACSAGHIKRQSVWTTPPRSYRIDDSLLLDLCRQLKFSDFDSFNSLFNFMFHIPENILDYPDAHHQRAQRFLKMSLAERRKGFRRSLTAIY
ncbi:unnamed protein product [Caenorhabditis auriculariae]|uniref:Uncharacterized protein n=1 Tax=Caenorhabditis auriculariae TaxID=2777116 RepID=A0A8S1HJ18_9PELO|nr:unnamed protein product [Caenorhabditis auriculariae]